MPVTVGSASKINRQKLIALNTAISDADKTTFADTVYPAGMWLFDTDGKIYHADGVKTLAQLLANPVIDPSIAVLTAAERAKITNAGSANGFVVADANNKVLDSQLNLVGDDGKLADSYLGNYFENGILKLSACPEELRLHFKFVADIAARDALSDEDKKGPVFVVDASADPTVGAGWAVYVFTTSTSGDVTTYTPVKIAEGEGLDLNFDDIVNYSRVQAAGAVMYDHPIMGQAITLTEYATLSAASGS